MNGPLETVGDTLELIDGPVFTAAARLIVSIIPESEARRLCPKAPGHHCMSKRSRVLLYDDSGWVPGSTSPALQRFLTAAWAVGTQLFPGTSIGADSWRDAYHELEQHQAEHGPIRELHVWGHGSKGRPAIGPVRDLDLDTLAGVLPHLDVVWWRSCSVHADKRFARAVTEKLECTSVGHCQVITWPNPMTQRAVCGLREGEDPHWEKRDGVWVNGEGRPLPYVSTFRRRVPWNKRGAWAPR